MINMEKCKFFKRSYILRIHNYNKRNKNGPGKNEDGSKFRHIKHHKRKKKYRAT